MYLLRTLPFTAVEYPLILITHTVEPSEPNSSWSLDCRVRIVRPVDAFPAHQGS